MLIRYGYAITITCAQDTPLICMMAARDDRRDDVQWQVGVVTEPAVATTVYRDMFGNACRRLVALAGRFRMREDTTRGQRPARCGGAVAEGNPGGGPAG